MRYEYLVKILDQICKEAPTEQASRYHPNPSDIEKTNQARARAFIHLYLKVMFGISEFKARERTLTDNAYDGGIDGYFIDTESKNIYFIQSKFRTTKENFESKEISLEEILCMDVARIMDGDQADEMGNPYNGKIKQLQREVSSLPDVARYSYRVIVLANLKNVMQSKLRLLTGGFSVEVFDFEKTYEKLVFPVLTGNYFAANDIVIPIDLSNKNAGSKISYSVKTKFSDCEITVLFVPAIEIAKIMSKYKNAVLKFNPRSYLDLSGQNVNDSIRETIVNTKTNEFALFNNGITILSDETNINEKIGQKNKAQLRIKNPQIINGGQTSFTLSRIFDEYQDASTEVFADKEVMIKVITVAECDHQKKLELIDEISVATNRQTPVFNADRFANDPFHSSIQKNVFDRYGVLYERKRGEFSDGIKDGYINEESIIERNFFWRLYFAANGRINLGIQKRLFQKNQFPGVYISNDSAFDRLYIALLAFKILADRSKKDNKIGRDLYGKIYIYAELFLKEGIHVTEDKLLHNTSRLQELWDEFLIAQRDKATGIVTHIDKNTKEIVTRFSEAKYIRGKTFERDLISYFKSFNEMDFQKTKPEKKS